MGLLGVDDKSDLTESSKSPASIAWSNKQWVGSDLYQEWYKPLLISCEALFGYEQVTKRIANIRLTNNKKNQQKTDFIESVFC